MSVNIAEELETIPNTAWTTECISECCSCNNAVNQAERTSSQLRTYSVNGRIDAVETIRFNEAGSAAQEAHGYSEKEKAC